MRILHTADWHLCTRLGHIDRTGDLKRRVETIAALCLEHDVDVLLIAGDLFCDRADLDKMTDAFGHIRKTFAEFFQRNGTILAITGNHDKDLRINMTRVGMTLASPVVGQDGNLVNGRMHLINGLSFVTLNSKCNQRVQFVLVPYPNRSRYTLPDGYRTKEEETQLLQQLVAEWVQSASGKPTFDPTLPTVLAAHLHIRGAEAHSLYQLTERDDVLFNFADLNPGWAYVALGHIHKPQALNGAENVRYPGSLDRLDFGETHDDHGVLLLDIDGANSVKPQRIPIPATPFHTIELSDPEAELSGLAEKYPDRETAIVKVTVAPTAAGPSRDEVSRELRAIFPRLLDVTWLGTADAEEAKPTFKPKASFAETVREFLTDRLADDPNKDAVLQLAERFLSEELHA